MWSFLLLYLAKCSVLAQGPENKTRLVRKDQDGGFNNLPMISVFQVLCP